METSIPPTVPQGVPPGSIGTVPHSHASLLGGIPVWMDESARPSRQARALHEAMAQGRVPSGALYAAPFQALRWLALHEAWSPARRDEGVQLAYDSVFGVLAEGLGKSPWTLVSLGCGGGQKEERFLRGCSGRPRSALVADISPGLALASHERVSAWCETHAGVIDLEASPGPAPWCDALLGDAGIPRVVFFLGMLPNMDLGHAGRVLRAWTRPGDWVVASANLASPAECAAGLRGVLPQYDNAETRAWLSGFLEWQGIGADRFDWTFGFEAVPAHAGSMARVTADAVLRSDVCLTVPGHEPVRWEAGRLVRVFHSLRMSMEAASGFAAGAGLRRVHAASDAAGQEGVFLLRR